ncbi:MAG TPA: tripartite tricarboxylate transporter substrate-binding protein [Burkholderiales bacterium]|nr:tripartite tricarboxylate transporter substrate-binding protein [Burkholderiales bacterium]
MNASTRIVSVASALIAAAVMPVSAQDAYPNKVVRIVTPATGGGSDVLARMISPGLTASFGQQVVVDNRGAIAPEIVAKSPADGYTLMVNGSPLWLLPVLRKGTPWNPVRDFAPITLAVSSPSMLVVHPSVPARTVKELIAVAKAHPGKLNYAAGTIGATPHLAGELFKVMAGVNIVRVPYKGSGPGLIGLMIGEVEFMFPGAASAWGYVKQGRLRGLAIASAQPSPLFPGLLPLADTLPGYESISPQGIVAPAGTPVAIVQKLHAEIARVLNSADVKDKLHSSGIEVVASTPEEFGAAIKAGIARTTTLMKEAGIKQE